jgi:hypothetical protein
MQRWAGLVAITTMLVGCGAAKEAAIDNAMDQIWNEGDLSIIDDAYEEELANEIKRFVEDNRTLYPDLTVTIEDHVIKGNRYVTQWKVSGTHRDLGTPVTLEGVSLRTREDGVFTEERMFYDLKEVYDQLGFRVLPPDGVSPFDDVAAASQRGGDLAGAGGKEVLWPDTVPEAYKAQPVREAVVESLGDDGELETVRCKTYPCIAVVSWPTTEWRDKNQSLRNRLRKRGYDHFWHWPFVVEERSYAVLAFPAGVLEPERHARLEERMQGVIGELTVD